jgi:hypothetical protein
MRGLQIRRSVGDSELALTAQGIDTTCYPCLHISGRRRGGFEGGFAQDCTIARLHDGCSGYIVVLYGLSLESLATDRHRRLACSPRAGRRWAGRCSAMRRCGRGWGRATAAQQASEGSEEKERGPVKHGAWSRIRGY